MNRKGMRSTNKMERVAKMKKILIGVIAVGLVLLIPLESLQATETKTKTASTQANLGFSGELEGDFSYNFGIGRIDAGFSISGGIDLPIEIIVTYPAEINPGEQVQIGVKATGSSDGKIWVKLNAYIEGTVGSGYTKYTLGRYEFTEADLTHSVDLSRLATFDVPIGVDQLGEGRSTKIPIKTWDYEVDYLLGKWTGSTTVSFSIEVGMKVTSHVEGNIDIIGNALINPTSEEHNWSGSASTAYKKDVQISPDATAGASLTITANKLKYVVERIQLWLKSITLYIDSYNDWPVNDYSGEYTVDVERYFQPKSTKVGPAILAQSDRDNDEFVDDSGEMDIESISVSSDVPSKLGRLGDIIIGILVATVAVVIILVIRKKRKNSAAQMPGQSTTEKSSALECPNCGSINEPDSSFCNDCGTKLQRTQHIQHNAPQCPSCSTFPEIDSIFCDQCGTKLAEERFIASNNFSNPSKIGGDVCDVCGREFKNVALHKARSKCGGQNKNSRQVSASGRNGEKKKNNDICKLTENKNQQQLLQLQQPPKPTEKKLEPKKNAYKPVDRRNRPVKHLIEELRIRSANHASYLLIQGTISWKEWEALYDWFKGYCDGDFYRGR